MNGSLAESSIPLEWKHAIVTSVHKSSSRTNPANYRPISVLPIISKILERAVDIFFVYQSGFRSLHLTSTYLADVTNTLLQNFDKGQLTGLTNAFHTLDHGVLLNTLTSHHRRRCSIIVFSKAPVHWFKAYWTDRTQSIVVNGSTFSIRPLRGRMRLLQ